MNTALHPLLRRRDPAARLIPLQPAWLAACLLLSTVSWVASAAASVLYHCKGPGGEQAYVSHTAGYKRCEKIGAWAPPRAVAVADRRPPQRRRGQPGATVLPGTPPRAVKANPAVLKVTPLDPGGSIRVRKLMRTQVWQPFPVAVLDRLGGQVLPRLLGVAATPVPTPAPAASLPVSTPAATAAIPLHVDAAAGKPRPPRTGAVYRVVQKNGTVLYTNIAALAKQGVARKLFTYIVECYACDVHSRIDWNRVPLHLAAYGGDIRAAAELTGVDGALLRAIIHAESGFNPRALSYKGAQGLMQLMPDTAFELGVGDAFDPAENISGGARYLAMLLRDYHGDVKLAAAAYNAGAGAVAKYRGVPPYAETQVYVQRVAVLYQRYRKALVSRAAPALAAVKAAD
jgi:soluble lytic murein transglycosylase-like protein